MVKKVFYSWDELTSDVDLLAEKLKPLKFNFKNIYGIPRGGTIIAIMLSHRLNLPVVFLRGKVSNDTLIVDDVSHTGSSLKKIVNKNHTVVTLWASEKTKVVPSYFCNVLLDNEWIVFPFETLLSSKRDNIYGRKKIPDLSH